VSYNQYPERTEVSFQLPDYVYTMPVEYTAHDTPPKIEKFLHDCGWSYAMNDPNTMEVLYQKHVEMDAGTLYYRWYEAMAYEFWKFLTISSGSDK
jgi:hypothetical protein